jgi:hypothetical protein
LSIKSLVASMYPAVSSLLTRARYLSPSREHGTYIGAFNTVKFIVIAT